MQCSIVDWLRIFVPGVFVFPRAFALYIVGIKLGGFQYEGPFPEGSLTFGVQPHLKLDNCSLILDLLICNANSSIKCSIIDIIYDWEILCLHYIPNIEVFFLS